MIAAEEGRAEVQIILKDLFLGFGLLASESNASIRVARKVS